MSELSTPLRPRSPYGMAKDATRHLLAGMCALRNTEFSWARVFFLYGPGEASQRLVPSVIDVLTGKRAPFPLDGEATRDFLHVHDVAEGLAELSAPGHCGEYNICSGHPTKIGDIIGQIAQCLGTNAESLERMFAPRLDQPRVLVGCNTRLRSTGWKPRYSIAGGLMDTVRDAQLRSTS